MVKITQNLFPFAVAGAVLALAILFIIFQIFKIKSNFDIKIKQVEEKNKEFEKEFGKELKEKFEKAIEERFESNENTILSKVEKSLGSSRQANQQHQQPHY